MARHWCTVALFLLSLSGCGQVQDRLEALPDAEADLHEAPHADGRCNARPVSESWVFANSGEFYMFAERENLRLALDPCGSSVVALSYFSELWPRTRTMRLFRDGAPDSEFLTPTDVAASHLDLKVDPYGNILLLSESWLQVLTPAGFSHAGVPAWGLGLWGDGIAAGPDDTWFIYGSVDQLVTLPSGNVAWHSDTSPATETEHRISVTPRSDREIMASRIYEKFATTEDSSSYTAIAVYLYTPGTEDYVGQQFMMEPSEDDPTFYVDTALLAVGSEATYLGTTAYTADPVTHARIECREPMLVNIEDSDWKPDPFGFCGALEALAVAEDGSIVSLWTVPVEPLDAEEHPFEAEPTLVRHSPNGKGTGRWVLTDLIGRTAQDGTGAMDMALDEGGKAAVVGALIGGPWNGRFFESPSKTVVAKVRLD